MADQHEVSQFVVSATRVIHILREDIDVSSSDEVLIEGVLHCLIIEASVVKLGASRRLSITWPLPIEKIYGDQAA